KSNNASCSTPATVLGKGCYNSIEERRVRYTRAYILHIIRGILMLDKSQNLVHLRWLLKLVDFRQASELS
ncbi:hypothetical protein Goari_004626, partial [Gossypium aridum]|nr:hypothetical protein [Gossypium aridum]